MANRKTKQSTLLTGTRDLIDDALRNVLDGRKASLGSRQTCIDLSEHGPDGFDIQALVSQLYQKIEQNWKSVARRVPSSKNWDLTCKLMAGPTERPRQVRLAVKNRSAEVVLERLIIQAVLNEADFNHRREDWFHQCPTASGVYSSKSDRCHIDLIHRISAQKFELVELKVASNNPIFAAFEILRNGLLYLHARQSLIADYADKPLLKARKIRLTVLAPWDYYTYTPSRGAKRKMYDLRWFEKGLDRAISAVGKHECKMKMTFAFEAFPKEVKMKERAKRRAFTDEELLSAVNERQAAFAE